MGYSAEDIEGRAEKLYTLYRAKRHHDSPALLIRNLCTVTLEAPSIWSRVPGMK